MAVENKKGFKWRGLATFMLVLGILVEIVSGVVLYITPLGRFANWTNWTLLGLNKHEWASIHTVFGYFLLIIIGLHLYFNWRVLLHFFWSKLHSSFNLKREFIVAAAVVAMVFAGILWNIPPFSAVMDLGRDAKLSWEKNSDMSTGRGGRWVQSAYEDDDIVTSRQQDGGRWAMPNTYLDRSQANRSEFREGRGINNPMNNTRFDDGRSSMRGQGKGRVLNRYSDPTANGETGSPATLKGRDYVRMGEMKTFTGSLVEKGDEWELKVGNTPYELHMGPIDFRNAQGLVLTNGAQAVVSGFVYGADLSVTTIQTVSKSTLLRDESGRPLWGGSGFGRGAGRIN